MNHCTFVRAGLIACMLVSLRTCVRACERGFVHAFSCACVRVIVSVWVCEGERVCVSVPA